MEQMTSSARFTMNFGEHVVDDGTDDEESNHGEDKDSNFLEARKIGDAEKVGTRVEAENGQVGDDGQVGNKLNDTKMATHCRGSRRAW